MLDKSLIICYSTPNYSNLAQISIESLYEYNVKSENIVHKQDIPPEELTKKTGFMTDLFHYCIIHKVEHLLKTLKKYSEFQQEILRDGQESNDRSNLIINNKYDYYISLDMDIWFIKKNEKEWINLKKIIDDSDKDIFFMRENTSNNVNGGFFIIKNRYINTSISFLEEVYNDLLTKKKSELPMLEQQLINEKKNKINYDYIPNEYVIFGNIAYNPNKSLFHHAVCCNDVSDKLEQINLVKSFFGLKKY